MGQLGIGVMLKNLGGNESSVNAILGALNKKIAKVWLEDDALRFEMEDGYRFKLSDEGQSCCEQRYMVCDDDLSQHVGETLLEAEVAPADNAPDRYGEHEIEFLRVKTTGGVIVVSNHNEHNGYYGGFCVRASTF